MTKKRIKAELEAKYAINDHELMNSIGKTGIYIFLYFPKEKVVTMSQEVAEICGLESYYENIPDSYLPKIATVEEQEAFRRFYREILDGADSSVAEFKHPESNHMLRVTLTTVRRDEKGNPEVTIGVIENITELAREKKLVNEVTDALNAKMMESYRDENAGVINSIAYGIGELYYAIYHIWLSDHTYICYREELAGILGEIGERGAYEPAWETYITKYIVEEDQAGLREFADINTMEERLHNKKSISFVYRRKGIGWTRGQFIAAKRDEMGYVTNVVYTVTDINDEIETKLEKNEAEKAAKRDSLTGLMNRTAFDAEKFNKDFANRPVGFMIIDIDRFKDINDALGHDNGDEVLRLVAGLLKSSIRPSDRIFRVGGDEFAVLLYDCGIEEWPKICETFSVIHENLRNRAPEHRDVTLSAGLCLSDSGYHSDMYRLADLAMYHTKAEGRGGCSIMDENENIIREWHDDRYHLRNNYVLKANSAATWKADLPKHDGVKGSIYFDEAMKSMLGIGDTMTPEEQFVLWQSGIEESYLETVTNAWEAVIAGEQVEILYRWRQPKLGYILTRWGAAYDNEDEDFYYVYGFYHEIKDTHIFSKLELGDEIRNALEEIYFCSFYLNLKNFTYITYKVQPYMRDILGNEGDAFKTVSLFCNHMVAEEYKEEMSEFLDLTTLSARLVEKNMISADYLENGIGWCRAHFIVVKRDVNGVAEAVSMVVESIDDQKRAELEKTHELREKTEIIDCLTGEFESVVYLDFEEDEYFAVSENDYFVNILSRTGAISSTLQNSFNGLLSEENSESVKMYRDLEKVQRVLTSTDHLRVEFLAVEGGWYLAEYQVLRRLENGRPASALLTAKALKEQEARTEEERLEKLAAIPAKSTVEGDRSMEAFFNNVPGGLIMYEWDGKQLKTLHISEYYARQYGQSLVSKGANEGGPDFMRTHPEDLPGYQAAVLNALTNTHHLDYTYRVWNEETLDYRWNRINAISIPQTDGTSLVYALYTDITELKEAELELEKNRASMETALQASNQLCYEYDPVEHTGICYTDSNFFNLPKVIEGYPDSLVNYDLFHPEDEQLFIRTAHRMDHETEIVRCDVRIKSEGEYGWYNCAFTPFFDEEKGYHVAILNVVDINLRVTAIHTYEERLKTLMYANEEALCIGSINLTQGSVTTFRGSDSLEKLSGDERNYNSLLKRLSKGVVGEKDQKEYLAVFGKERLMMLERTGKTHVQFDHMYRIRDNHSEWIQSSVDMVRNPITNDLEAICSAKSIHDARLNELMLKKVMEQDYPMAAVIFKDSKEYFFYSAEQGIMGRHRIGFWESILVSLTNVVKDIKPIQKALAKEYVLEKIETENEYVFAFDADKQSKQYRLEFKFSYLDAEQQMIFASLRNITDVMLLGKLRHDNEHDKLTDLYNRKTVFRECRKLLNDHPDKDFVMLHFDIKHFHLYNTFYGDAAGDELLRKIAARLNEMDASLHTWTYGRIEADVFCLFFPYKEQTFTERMLAEVEELRAYRDDFLIEPSVGVYHVSDRTLPIEAMFTRATMAAKTNKNNSAEVVSLYNTSMEEQTKKERDLVAEMHVALEEGQFVPYYQPKYSLRTEKPVGAEALVRWLHPEKGMMSPGDFIPLFEGNGFIADLDRYMWEEVCKQLKTWKEQYETVAPVSVNVSRISMYSPTTVQFLKDLVTKYDVEPELLQLELTESAYMDDPVEIKAQLAELQSFGFKILMDDFGSGYSSLNTLRELPVDCIKLDRSFLRESNTDKRAQLVLSAIIRMSKLLNLSVVAEGVEFAEQANYLRSLGCEYAQGFLFARPMPVKEYEALMDHEEEIQVVTYPEEGKIKEILENDYHRDITFAEETPFPVTVAEINEDGFICLRMNLAFLEAFEMKEADEVAEANFKKHLSEEDYRMMHDAMRKCGKTKKATDFKISRKKKNGEVSVYSGIVTYKGNLGRAPLILITFADISKYVN